MSRGGRSADTASAPGDGVTTILVVDDKETNRLLIQQLFDGPGYRVLEATDGLQGIAVAQAERPDCILLDLDMPRLGGFDALDRLEQDPRTREIPVIILTASDDSFEGMDRALQAGAVDYITKPISPRRVAIRVRGAIERRRLLQEVNNLRASFTSMLVHDLRAPLTIIEGYIQLMEAAGNSPSDKHPRYLRAMRQSCQRMIRFIGEIMDLSKLEAGKLALEPQPMDLVALAADVVERMQSLALSKKITLGVRSAGSASLVADPSRVDQVLMNLIGNALKFSPEGGAIDIEVSDVDDELEVVVSDSGPGISPEELPLLFEKFSQTSSARAAGHGTGLGLVVCRHLVEAHGGRIWAESKPGMGSRFVFRLPRSPS